MAVPYKKSASRGIALPGGNCKPNPGSTRLRAGFTACKIRHINHHNADALAIANTQRQQELEAEIEGVIAADETMSQDSANMQSVPGIGLGVHNVLMALCYRQLKELPHRKLLALCGMVPRENQSGESAMVSVRRKLFNPVQAVVKPTTTFNPVIYSKMA